MSGDAAAACHVCAGPGGPCADLPCPGCDASHRLCRPCAAAFAGPDGRLRGPGCPAVPGAELRPGDEVRVTGSPGHGDVFSVLEVRVRRVAGGTEVDARLRPLRDSSGCPLRSGDWWDERAWVRIRMAYEALPHVRLMRTAEERVALELMGEA